MNDNKKAENCQSIVFAVYVIWCAPTNKFYVGVTRQKSVATRIRQHKRGKKQFIDKEIKKIGWDGNFDYWIVEENIPSNQISDCEKRWVEFFGSVYPNGYNKTFGGIGHITVSDYTREKMRQNALERGMGGENNPMYGRHHTEEARAKISEARKVENLSDETRAKMSDAQKGKKLSEETKAKISAAVSGEKNGFYGKHHTEETKEKDRQAHIGKPSWNKGVPCAESTKAKLRKKALERDVSGENNPFYGKHHSAETKAILSAKLSGENSPNFGKHLSEATKAKLREKALARAAAKRAAKEAAEQAAKENSDS